MLASFDSWMHRFSWVLVLILSFGYFASASSGSFTWIFTSGDSGELLATALYWTPSQPYGLPLYQLLAHLLSVFPGSLVAKLTIVLSSLPGAVTVTMVFLIVKRLTSDWRIAYVCALALIGSAVFLAESTIIKHYALAIAMLTLGLWFYIRGQRKLTALFLGLGAAVHVIVVILTLLWFVVEWHNWRAWLRASWVWLIVVVPLYGFVAWELTVGEPPLMAGGIGGFTLGGIRSYLGSSQVFGTLAAQAAPERLLVLITFLIVCFGILIPALVRGLQRSDVGNLKLIAAGSAVFAIWYYTTDLDPTTWTTLAYASPFIVILAGLGLQKMKFYHVQVIGLVAALLVVVNGVWLNADRLTNENPVAQTVEYEALALPDCSYVLVHRGGFDSMAVWWAMAQQRDMNDGRGNLMPVFFQWDDYLTDPLYVSYCRWMQETCGFTTVGTANMVQELLTAERTFPSDSEYGGIYCLSPLLGEWENIIETEKIEGFQYFERVVGVDTSRAALSQSMNIEEQ